MMDLIFLELNTRQRQEFEDYVADFLAPVNKEVRQPIINNQALFNDFYEG